MVPALLTIHDVDTDAPLSSVFGLESYPRGGHAEYSVTSSSPPSRVLVNGSFHSFMFFGIVSLYLTLASLFGRHHSAAQRGGSSWSGLQLHQRGGIPWPGGKWTAAGERHIRWYVSTQHSFTMLEAEEKQDGKYNVLMWVIGSSLPCISPGAAYWMHKALF